MNRILKLFLVLFGCSVSLGAQAQSGTYQPNDLCVYPNGLPPDQMIFYGAQHVFASYVSTGPGTNSVINIGDSFDWGTTNDVTDPDYGCRSFDQDGDVTEACAIGPIWESCGTYDSTPCGGGHSCCDLKDGLNGYMNNGNAPGSSITYTESHDGTSFNVGEVNSSPGQSVTSLYAVSLADPHIRSANINNGKDRRPPDKCTNGMPSWSITEPYLNLWVQDCPVLYSTSLGEEVKFEVAYKQRDTRPTTTTVPISGWSHNWSSSVHFVVPTFLSDTNSALPGLPLKGSTGPVSFPATWVFTNDFSQWRAVLYAADNSESYFDPSETADSVSG